MRRYRNIVTAVQGEGIWDLATASMGEMLLRTVHMGRNLATASLGEDNGNLASASLEKRNGNLATTSLGEKTWKPCYCGPRIRYMGIWPLPESLGRRYMGTSSIPA